MVSVKKFWWVFALIIINALGIYYLTSPLPVIDDLPKSELSDEPGDTVQLKNVKAYYTNLSRQEVMDFYKKEFGGLLRIGLNHPPEKAKEIYRDTMQSYYLEELVLPMRQTLFVNGYEWRNDPFTKIDQREKNRLIYKGKEYSSKITLKTYTPSLYSKIAVLAVIQIGIGMIIWCYRKVFKK